MTNLKDFFSLWPDVIKAVTTSEGAIALLMLVFLAVLLVVMARDKQRPWFVVPLLLVLMLVGVIGLAALGVKQRPVTGPVMTDISAVYGPPGNVIYSRPEMTAQAREACEDKSTCFVTLGNIASKVPDPSTGINKVIEVSFLCGSTQRFAVLEDNKRQQLWCQ